MKRDHIWPISLTDEEAVMHSKKPASPLVDDSGDLAPASQYAHAIYI